MKVKLFRNLNPRLLSLASSNMKKNKKKVLDLLARISRRQNSHADFPLKEYIRSSKNRRDQIVKHWKAQCKAAELKKEKLERENDKEFKTGNLRQRGIERRKKKMVKMQN